MRLKVCGLKTNIEEVVLLQPDYIGLIFWENSKRFVADPLPTSLKLGIPRVGVFVDAKKEEVLQRIQTYNLELVQLHGDETPEYCRELKSLVESTTEHKVKIIKAFAVGATFNFEILEKYLSASDYFLFDSRGPLPGGNGTHFNWNLLSQYYYNTPYFLSGGISESDLPQLSEFMKSPGAAFCHAIDINSQFEFQPGQKDIEKLKRFMRAPFWLEHKNLIN
ncbi:MAG: hypothetical protein RLZZ241_2270 [Bacteroidota bacterium]|jgi:phosphoribosylanthranilate isomerase